VDALKPAQRHAVDEQARALDKHAYSVSDVYRATTPARVG
jgi:hypothetical protein